MKRKFIGLVILAIVFISGCASTSGPTSDVGIVNGKYAVQTTIPNNNKGKKVNLIGGQSYSCENLLLDKNGKQIKYTFDLKLSQDGHHMTWYNDKHDGKTLETSYIGKLVFKPLIGFVETTKNGQVIVPGSDNAGVIGMFYSVSDVQKFYKISEKFQNGKITQSESLNLLEKQQIRVSKAVCTQITNNTYTHTRYLTDHEIDAYKHGQQIAVQQRAVDSANYNASMARMQEQNAQINYNTQQMFNRMNTYKVKVY